MTAASPAHPRRKHHWQPVLATLPMIAIVISVFVVGALFTIYWSFTSSRVFPGWTWVGLYQYVVLWKDADWQAAVRNMAVFGPVSLAINLVVGFILAVALDQHIRAESLFRSIFLYPFAMSLYVTGLVWQWVLDPHLGLQATVRSWGLSTFQFAPLSEPGQEMVALVLAGCWQSVGLTMAILLAGLRGIDQDIWSALRIDGVPRWRAYLFVVLPTMRGAVATALLLQVTAVIRTFDLVVAMSSDPYNVTSMPALYVDSMIRYGSNLGRGSAAAAMMLGPIAIVLLIRTIVLWQRRRRAGMNA